MACGHSIALGESVKDFDGLAELKLSASLIWGMWVGNASVEVVV